MISTSKLLKAPKPLLAVGLMTLLLTAILGVFQPKAFFSGYLVTLVFWLSISLGSLALLFLHQLVGGRWELLPAPFLHAQSKTLWLVAVAFIPLLFGLDHLYIWTNQAYMQSSETLMFKTLFLNKPGFIIRSIIYFLIWLALLHFYSRFRGNKSRLKGLSGVGLLLMAFTSSLAAFDWLMTFDPHWHSTVFGGIFIGASLLNCTAFSLALSSRLYNIQKSERSKALLDLSTLMFAFLFVWMYMSFSQYLIIWSGQIPPELAWYDRRSHGLWFWVTIALLTLRFAAPLILFLFRKIKSAPRLSFSVALTVFGLGWVEFLWLVLPSYSQLNIIWLILYAGGLIGLSLAWISGFMWFLNHELSARHKRELAV